jgi:hypothetical protein
MGQSLPLDEPCNRPERSQAGIASAKRPPPATFCKFLEFRELWSAKWAENGPKTHENRQILSKYLAKIRFSCKNPEIAGKAHPGSRGARELPRLLA